MTYLKSWLSYCLLLLIGCKVNSQEYREHSLSLEPYIKYRQENLDWSIAGDENGQNPNVFSELIWKKVRGPQLGLLAEWKILKKLSIGLDLSYLNIVTGRVTDADYADDHRQQRFSYEELNADRGHVILLKARLQYHLYSGSFFAISPYLAYINKHQRLYMSDNEIALVESKHLNSTYQPSWQGASLGTEFLFYIRKAILSIGLSGSLLDYYAKADWNLIEEYAHPISFEHRAKGQGFDAQFQFEYPVFGNLFIMANADISFLETNIGTDKLFYLSGSSASTQLNGVSNKSFGMGGGLKLLF